MDDLAQLMIDILDRMGLEKVSLVGHSMGGTVATLMAERAPAGSRGCCSPRATSGPRTLL